MNDMPSKYFFRQRMKNRTYDAVIAAVENAAATHGMRKKDIAEKLGVNPSQVTRWLSGPANWGADTISDLLFAVGAELEPVVVTFAERQRQKSNRFHPLDSKIATPKRQMGRATETAELLVQIPLAVAGGASALATDHSVSGALGGGNVSPLAIPQGARSTTLAAPLGLDHRRLGPTRQLAAAQSQQGVS